MKHTSAIPALLIFLVFSSLRPEYQNQYPRDQFISPVNFTLSLSATFGDLRQGYLHSGIDIRTQGVEGKSVRAVADGWVSRVVVSPTGFGKAIYIDHPNGYTSVYAHLKSFYRELQAHVRSRQYQMESFSVDLTFDKDEFPVKQGQIIGLSGNSGTSRGPHLHFEIRETKSEIPVNPLHFGLPLKDYIKPQIKGLWIYPHGPQATVNGRNKPLLVKLRGWGPNYRPAAGHDTIRVTGPVYFGIEAYDRHNDSEIHHGVYAVTLTIDSETVFSSRMDKFSFDESRYMKAMVDYAEMISNRRRIQRTIILPNNDLSIYETVKDRGIYTFSDQKIYQLQYFVRDFAGNQSVLTFHVKGEPISSSTSGTTPSTINPDDLLLMHWNRDNLFRDEGITLEIPREALFDTIHFRFKIGKPHPAGYSPTFHLHNRLTPICNPCTLYIRPKPAGNVQKQQLLIASLNEGTNKPQAIGGEWENGYIKTLIKEFGTYVVLADVKPPVITPLNFSNGQKLSSQTSLKLKVSDDLAGIGHYRATLNEKWILMEWDPKNNLMEYHFDEHLKKGKNRLRLEVSDTRGNTATFEVTVLR